MTEIFGPQERESTPRQVAVLLEERPCVYTGLLEDGLPWKLVGMEASGYVLFGDTKHKITATEKRLIIQAVEDA